MGPDILSSNGLLPCADLEMGTGGPDPPPPPPPLKNHKNIGFLNTIYCSGSPKITKLPSKHSMLDHHLHASKMPFKWCFAGWPMMACLWGGYFDPPSPHQLKKKTMSKLDTLKKQNTKKFCRSYTKLRFFHI